ncbi:MAG: chorismate mutase [Raoultibacter sp.]
MSENSTALAHIEQHRNQINAIDQQLVALLNERTGHALAIRALKADAHIGLYDPRREEEIFERVYSFNEGPLYNDHLRAIYEGILKVMKETPSL